MKLLLFISMYLCLSGIALAQFTFIPDPSFENFLIANGIDTDGVVNGQVLTSDIEDEIIVEIYEFPGITDLTGIEDFTSLEFFRLETSNVSQLDLSSNLNLYSIDIMDVSLEGLNINNLVNLEVLHVVPDFITYSSTINSLDLSDNILLRSVHIGENSITHLDLSNNPVIDNLHLCGMDDIISINIKNGNNELIDELRICNNISLECIQVDDPVAVIAATDPPYNSWEFFNINNALITDDCQLGIDGIETARIAVYPNPVSEVLYLETQQNTIIEQATIFDSLGRKVFHKNGNLEQVNMSSLPSGLYFLQLQTTNGTLVEKVVKQ